MIAYFVSNSHFVFTFLIIFVKVVKEENIKEQITTTTNTTNNTPIEKDNDDGDDENVRGSLADIEQGKMENVILDDLDDFTETDDTTQLYIPPHKRKSPQQCCMVSNLCAICLDSFHVDDVVVWSSNSQCQHVFHEFCIIDYLVKVKKNKGQPCPTCRQNFIDLIDMNKLSDNNTNEDIKKTNNENETSNTAAAAATAASTTAAAAAATTAT